MIRTGLRVAFAAALALVIGLAQTAVTSAQDARSTLRPVKVGLYVSPPFVMLENGRPSGMAVDVWQALAARLGLDSEYQEHATLRDLVAAVASGDVDVAVTNLTITKDRAERIDFTHPWFDAGLKIMVSNDRTAGFRDVLVGLENAGHLRAYAWLALVIVVATLLLTVFDRHFDRDFPRRWREGLAESFYSVMSIATSGRSPSRKNLFGWIGRIWQGAWLVCGVAVLAYITSSITSVMTTLSLTNQIDSLEDLDGRTAGVFTGSVAEEFARSSGLRFVSFPHIDEAVPALIADRVAAVIGDAPVLEYYAHTRSDVAAEVVGGIFEPDKYGFGLAHGSPLTRPLTVELLGAHESGFVEELRTKYFGAAE